MFKKNDFICAFYHGCVDGLFCFTVYSRYNNSDHSAALSQLMLDGLGFRCFDDFAEYAKKFPESVNGLI